MSNTQRIILILILLVGFALRVRLASDHCLHDWDERFHALVAKNMMKHPLKPTLYENPILSYDYKAWYSNHVWLHKQPLPLWLISFSYSCFGLNEFNTRLPSLIFSMLAIFVTFLLGKNLFNIKVGLMASFFMAINGLVLEIGAGRVATDHFDLIFMALIELSILLAFYGAQKKKLAFALFSGFFVGLAVLTKWLPCLIVFPIQYLFLKQSNLSVKDIIKQLGSSIIVCLVVSIPWQLYILQHYPLESKWEYFHHWLHLTQKLDGQNGTGYFYFLDQIRINYSDIVYLPLLYYILQLKKAQFKNSNLLVLCIWIFIPIVFFTLAETKMQGYILFICPALFLLTADFFFVIKDFLYKQQRQKGLKIALWLVLIAILFLPLRYCFERTSFGFADSKCGKYFDYYKGFKAFDTKSIVLNVEHPIQFMYYNNCTAYPFDRIEKNKFDSLSLNGFSFFEYDRASNKIRNYKTE
jgi:4-amino-4-deoxy-L-arabinose transferase